MESDSINWGFGLIIFFYVVIFLIIQTEELADERAERVGIKASTYTEGKVNEVVQR